MVFFPHMISPVFVSRGRSIATIESMPPQAQQIFVVAQRDSRVEEAEPENLYEVGTVAEVLQVLRLSDGTFKVLLEGVQRARLVGCQTNGDGTWAEVLSIDEKEDIPPETAAQCRDLLFHFEDYLRINHRIPHEVYAAVENMGTPSSVADAIAASVSFKLSEKQRLLECVNVEERIAALRGLLDGEIELLKMERKVRGRVRQQMDHNQKEFYLTEQLKAIQRELGQVDGVATEGEELRQRAEKVLLPKEITERVEKEIRRLEMMAPLSAESSVVRGYVEWLIDVPWKERTRDQNNLTVARDVLERDHFGLKKVKERILEHLAVKILNKAIRGPILCFVGPPGVGKTSLGRSIAGALGRKFVRVSLGGIRDEAEIRGHRRTYIGALPGRIIQSMKKAGTLNPVFMLDEVDKMSADFRGDPASALLEVLDPEQNRHFSDHYLEVDYDLSRVFFIATANTTDAIPGPLLDRMEIIRIAGYSEEEKYEIARRFLFPRQRKENGLDEKMLEVEDATILRIIREYTREAGVRNLERELGNLSRKVARRLVEKRREKKAAKKGRARKDKQLVRITAAALETYIGIPRFIPERPESRAEVGVATGLAWTSAGGVLLPVEVGVYDGKGVLTLTGKLGEVMKESARAGLSWLRMRAKELGIPANFHEKKDIHIHLPEGAISKDGPSAGVTMALAMASALTGRKVRHDVAISGEVTLRGRVLPVGGVKEKMLAARRNGIPNVIFPKENEKDVREVEEEGPLGMNVIFVESMDDIVSACLTAAKNMPVASKGKASAIRPRQRKTVSSARKAPPSGTKKETGRTRRISPGGR